MMSIHIVVADDEAEIREFVADVLEEAGYCVTTVGDGQSALAAVRALSPAVALLDVAMPVMTGDEVLRRICAQGLAVPVVMMTATPNPGRMLQLGATAVLPKPFDLSALLDTVAQARSGPRPLRERSVGGGQGLWP